MTTTFTQPARPAVPGAGRDRHASRNLLLGLAGAAATAALVWFGTGLHAAWPLTWLIPVPMLVAARALGGRTTAVLAALGWMVGTLNLWSYATVRLQAPLPIVLGLIAIEGACFAAAVATFRALAVGGRLVSAVLAAPAVAVLLDTVLSRLSPHGTFTSIA